MIFIKVLKDLKDLKVPNDLNGFTKNHNKEAATLLAIMKKSITLYCRKGQAPSALHIF